MRKELRQDGPDETTDFPYGWSKGDTCVMITNKAKETTSEYTVETYDGEYFGVWSRTGLSGLSVGRALRLYQRQLLGWTHLPGVGGLPAEQVPV